MEGAAEKARRVHVGFHGGQVLELRMIDAVYGSLRKALEDGGGERWHELTTEDSDVAIDLSQVVYIRLDTEQHKVGF